MSRLAPLLLILSSLALAATAQETSAPQDKSREDWLRYSNWEHRATKTRAPGTTLPGTAGGLAGGSSPGQTQAGKTPLPEYPGSQTVEGVQPTVPGWALQPGKEVPRYPQIIVGDTSGYTSNFLLNCQQPGSLFAGSRLLVPGGSRGGLSYGGASGIRSFLGQEVIETGPSPASGNYYAQVFSDRGAYLRNYESASPWLAPVIVPVTPRDYWGPQGNPFK
jgi:hypothetical protein